MNIRYCSCFLLALILSGCASNAGNTVKPVTASAVALDDDQVRSTLIGNKLNNIGTSGLPYSLSFNADGTDIFKMSGNPPETERWTVKDGVICFTSAKISKECYRLKKDKDDYWLVHPDTGAVHYHYTLTPQ
ncbi:hypothetical protein PS918_02149 [Pseudomonas fluorescens]|uniref:Lipoprotein n=1 Tax=Pseudomonas fluorescens TaxID=294 RepID=A0A5E7RY29_PSEFL|nr:hypothetical protein [Pseudomonas fluorescens]VVP79472.1 hypothetical protein PS918_02149 [Pseudomonas fluorescens]